MEELETLEAREYELSVILAEEAALEAVVKIISNIKDNGGVEVVSKEVKAVELAYPIKKHRSGFLASFILKMVPANTHILSSTLRFTPEVLRSLTITPPIKKGVVNRKPMRDYSDRPSEILEKEELKSAEPVVKLVKPEISSNNDLSKELEKLEATGSEPVESTTN
jgi:ribosomal protein S6